MDIDIWAEELLKDVCEKWETPEYKYAFKDCGFRVFYSPVHLSPDLMIIGYNPGKDDKPFSKEEDSADPGSSRILISQFQDSKEDEIPF